MGKYKYSNLKQESKTSGTVSLQKVKQTKTKKPGVRQPKMPAWFKNWSDNQFQPLVETVKQQGKKIDSLDVKVNSLDVKVNSLDAKVNSLDRKINLVSNKLNRVVKLNKLKA